MLRHRHHVGSLALVFGVAALTSCSDVGEPGATTLSVDLTDAPHALLQSVDVEIGQISIKSADGGFVTLTESGGMYDLLTLQDGLTATMADIDLDPGTYLELRLSVLSAVGTLKPGMVFEETGTAVKSVDIPSGARSGIKISLDAADGDLSSAGILVEEGATGMVVDFDVSSNFVLEGSPNDPSVIKDIKFTPRLRAVVATTTGGGDIAGSISGIVMSPIGPAPGVTVEAVNPADPNNVPARAITDGNGNFTIQFLPPGQYTVSAPFAPPASPPPVVSVGPGEDVTGVLIEVMFF